MTLLTALIGLRTNNLMGLAAPLTIDLQNFVNELQYVPLELSREGESTEELRKMGIHAAIAKNKAESCYEPSR
jgi:hypothetical protein